MSTTPLPSSTLARQGPGGASAFIDTAGRLGLAYASFAGGEHRGVRPNPADPVNHPRRLAITQVSSNSDGSLRLGG